MYLYRLREVNIIILTRGYDRLADRGIEQQYFFSMPLLNIIIKLM